MSNPEHTTEDVWYLMAAELARQPRDVTTRMRDQHPRGDNGRCAGFHADPPDWPCSTRQLADAADKIRPVAPQIALLQILR